VRWRRRDLALLKTIGFQRSQVRATVAWQATTVAVVALIVGIPVGVAGGRWGWTWLADRMHAVPEPVTPWLALAILLPGTVILVNAVAAIPAGSAARTRPAAILRAE
jgi:putative ABC transport system permease protein